MRFSEFEFWNFKGIQNLTLSLNPTANQSVYTLVGLNESGKTTILEAINFFIYKIESLDVLELDNYTIGDIHDLIPINGRDNFNETIGIKAILLLDDQDKKAIRIAYESSGIVVTQIPDTIEFTQKYRFENSTHIKDDDKRLWSFPVMGKVGSQRKPRKLRNSDLLKAFTVVTSRIPSILYFPNFLFEFPERIYLDPSTDSSKHKFYQRILQDVLDTLDNELLLERHLSDRIGSDNANDQRNLTSLVSKMERKLSTEIFGSWNQIFERQISNNQVILYTGEDDVGKYVEFNIKNDVDTYRLTERSLGFRWFFVYVLFTHFRSKIEGRSRVLFLFDEPASNLHPSAQRELLSTFARLSSVIYTTHSHYMINPSWLENTYVVKNEGLDYSKEDAYSANNTNISVARYRSFVNQNPTSYSYFQPILDVLDYRPSDLSAIGDTIICEGKNDFYTYKYASDVLELHPETIRIVPGVSANNLETLISLHMGWGANFLVLLDGDAAGQSQRKRYIKLFGQSIDGFIITLNDVFPDDRNVKCEDLFELSDRLHIQSLSNPDTKRFSKKLFNRTLQELLASQTIVQLHDKSKDRLSKVFVKCKEQFSKSGP